MQDWSALLKLESDFAPWLQGASHMAVPNGSVQLRHESCRSFCEEDGGGALLQSVVFIEDFSLLTHCASVSVSKNNMEVIRNLCQSASLVSCGRLQHCMQRPYPQTLLKLRRQMLAFEVMYFLRQFPKAVSLRLHAHNPSSPGCLQVPASMLLALKESVDG